MAKLLIMSYGSLRNGGTHMSKKIYMPISKKFAEANNFEAEKVSYKRIGSRKGLVYTEEVNEELSNDYMRPAWREDKAESRNRKCLIEGKNGKPVRCTKSCFGCPKSGKLNNKTSTSCSLDDLFDRNGFEIADPNNSIEQVEFEIEMEQFTDYLKKKGYQLDRILSMLRDGYKVKDISEKLDIKKTTLYKRIGRINAFYTKFSNCEE